ncbi:lactate utilization protein [Thermodesulfobacteriota bacterium]
MEKIFKNCLDALRSRNINGIFVESLAEATRKVLELIPQGAVVGIGDSSTLRQLGLLQKLEERKIKVLNPFQFKPSQTDPQEAYEYTERVSREATLCEVFLTGTNALTQDGRLVNVDANGNRVAGMFWGHPISIITVGRNKIVKDLDEAFDRIRNTIAPNHSYIKTVESGGKRPVIPCAATGECNDCRSPQRVCNIFTIIEGKPLSTKLNVVIVNDDFGLGWDPSWPENRIKRIIDNHKKYFWVPRFDIMKEKA